MKIAIIGGGYVGLHTALRLTQANKYWDISILDIDKNKIDKFNTGMSPIDDFFMEEFIKNNPGHLDKITYKNPSNNWDYDVVFIALSTNPKKPDKARLNTDLVFEFAEKIKTYKKDISIIIRSTVNLDDSDKILNSNSNYWPEFLSQGVETQKNIDQNVNVAHIQKTDKLASIIFEELFKNKTFIKVGAKESILIKVMHNTLDAHLINLTNLFANISEENGIDFSNIYNGVEQLLSTRTKVKKPGIGYGGSCYPKDSYSLIEITESQQNKKLIQALDDFNKEQSFAFLTKEEIIRKANNIVVLGISFKGGTNDITRTPTLSLRKWLLDNNIKYKVWEPMISNEWTIEGEDISSDIENDIKESDLVIVASDWNEFKELLSNYDRDVIDLKTFIKDNGLMNLYRIGKK